MTTLLIYLSMLIIATALIIILFLGFIKIRLI